MGQQVQQETLVRMESAEQPEQPAQQVILVRLETRVQQAQVQREQPEPAGVKVFKDPRETLDPQEETPGPQASPETLELIE
jgi:hypothetical protein